MTGFEMMLSQLVKFIPAPVWEAVKGNVEFMANTVKTFDLRLRAIEQRQQAQALVNIEILHRLYHIQDGTRCGDEGNCNYAQNAAATNGYASAHGEIIRRLGHDASRGDAATG